MALSPEDTQLLLSYMQKNRSQYAPMVQAPALPQQSSAIDFKDLSGFGKSLGKMFNGSPTQGPVQPGAAPLPTNPSPLSQFMAPNSNFGIGDLLKSFGRLF